MKEEPPLSETMTQLSSIGYVNNVSLDDAISYTTDTGREEIEGVIGGGVDEIVIGLIDSAFNHRVGRENRIEIEYLIKGVIKELYANKQKYGRITDWAESTADRSYNQSIHLDRLIGLFAIEYALEKEHLSKIEGKPEFYLSDEPAAVDPAPTGSSSGPA